jgi:hypothetical protein
VPASTEEEPHAQVKANSFNCYCKVDLHADCMNDRRKSSPCGPPKATEPQPPNEQIIPSVATASAPSSTGGTCMTVCTNVEATHSTQRVLHYLESLKDVETERAGTRSSFAASSLWFSLLVL